MSFQKALCDRGVGGQYQEEPIRGESDGVVIDLVV